MKFTIIALATVSVTVSLAGTACDTAPPRPSGEETTRESNVSKAVTRPTEDGMTTAQLVTEQTTAGSSNTEQPAGHDSTTDKVNAATSVADEASVTNEVNDSNGGRTASTGDSSGCEFIVSKNELSAAMPTVAVVEWSLAGEPPTSAKLVFALENATATHLNMGGEAPVNLSNPNYRTLLLGLKQNSDYTFRIEAVRGEQTCVSAVHALPKTGTLAGAPSDRVVTVEQPEARTPGFILAPGGYASSGAYVFDADGAVVWYVRGPADPGRMHMDYEGENMWIMSLNPIVGAQGHLQVFSMDGQIVQEDVPGFEFAHHDFTVMPGGKIATMLWRPDFENAAPGEFIVDPESELAIRSPDGTIATPFRIGSNLYKSESYHCNAIHYIPEDDSFTISDLNPDLVVKVSSAGEVQWQLGGSCTDAPAGEAKCYDGDWITTHGHHLLPDGTFLLFNNFVEEEAETSRILEFDITASADTMTATPVKSHMGIGQSTILGDVQRLPNGHTLITYSTDGKIVEVDAEWNVVQTFSGNFGYSEWRPTLYGPPARL